MLGNLFLLAGLYLLLYVGGLYATEEYNRLAARGDSDLTPIMPPAVGPSAPAVAFPAVSAVGEEPALFRAPVLVGTGQPVGSVPTTPIIELSTITRIVIPSIAVDSKVIEVGWAGC